jgi:hypothetical protein
MEILKGNALLRPNSNYVVSFSYDINNLLKVVLAPNDLVCLHEGEKPALRLKEYLKALPCTVLCADIVLEQIEAGNLDPVRVLVIQHGIDRASQRLLDHGAVPFMLLMFESPLYAGDFYDQLDELEAKFLFSQVFAPLASESAKRRSVRFPSFSLSSLKTQTNCKWDERGFASMVVANKYVALQSFHDVESFEAFIWWIANQVRHLIRGNPAPVSFDLRKLQLQDKRLEAIGYFCGVGRLDLYGRGWNSLWRIPPKYRRQLHPIIGRRIKSVDNKVNLLKQYRFNLCVENVRYPGYVTEKIFDAMIANTIPVYFGAPDIADFVPHETFIDVSHFSNFEELHRFMSEFSVDSAATMLAAGQTFLHSKDGLQFSTEGVALSVLEKIKTHVDGR